MAFETWTSIMIDLLSNKKVHLLETLPNGDFLILLWIRLLCLAAVTNQGGLLLLLENTPYTPEMLAHYFRYPLQQLQEALSIYCRYQLIEIENNTIRLLNWSEYQDMTDLRRFHGNSFGKLEEHRRQRAMKIKRLKQGVLAKDAPLESENKKP